MSGARISNSLSSGSRASWRSQSREVNDGDGPSSLEVARRNADLHEYPEGDGQLLVGCNQTSGDIKKVLEVMKVVIYSKLVLHVQLIAVANESKMAGLQRRPKGRKRS